jgi:hypothetical protein
MRRRDLIVALVAAWPAAAAGQPAAKPFVGYLSGRTRDGDAPYMPETLRGFREAGYVAQADEVIE